MLDSAKYDTAKLINAVQASLNSAAVDKETATRGNVRLVAKGKDFRFSEGNQIQYLGKSDAPARFAQWHDDTARSFKRNGDPSDVLSTAILPVSLKGWLDDKFSLNAKPAKQVPLPKAA